MPRKAKRAMATSPERSMLGRAPVAGTAFALNKAELPPPPGAFHLFFAQIMPVNRLAKTRRLEQTDMPGLEPWAG